MATYDSKAVNGAGLKEFATQFVQKLKTWTWLTGQLNNKVDKVQGKGLSTEDYTTAEKTKLSGIETGAEVNQNAYGKVTVGAFDGTELAAEQESDGITILSDNGITLTPASVEGAGGIHTKSITISGPGNATTSAAGLMSAEDKTKLNGIAAGATANAPYTSNPAMNGTANPGSSDLYAKGDHVHPIDTSRASAADLQTLEGTVTQLGYEVNGGGDWGTGLWARVADLEEKSTRIYKFKGSVATWSALPVSGNADGDVWNVEEAHTYDGTTYPANTNWAWVEDIYDPGGDTQPVDNSHWEPIGGMVDIDFITNSEADAIAVASFNGEQPS